MSEKIQSQLKQNITKFGVLNIIGVILLVIFLPLVICPINCCIRFNDN